MVPYQWKKSIKAIKTMVLAYLRHQLFRTPLWGHLYVTRKCNLHCDYCFFRDPKKPDLPFVDICRVLDRMYELGITFLAFHGGEPTLRRDFVDIVRYASDKGFFTYLNTNGTHLTPDYIHRLGEAGIDLINLSVDSILEFKHSNKDYTHHKQVLADLLSARDRYGFEITTNFVLTNRNIDAVIETLELMHSFEIPVSVGFIVKHLFHDEQEPSLFFRTEAEKRRLFKILDEIVELRRQGFNIIEPVQYFQDIKRFVHGSLTWECLAGFDSIGIDTLGELKYCGTLPTETTTIFDVERLDSRELLRERKERYGDCHERCVTNCRYVTWYYYNHPIQFVMELWWFRKQLRLLKTQLPWNRTPSPPSAIRRPGETLPRPGSASADQTRPSADTALHRSHSRWSPDPTAGRGTPEQKLDQTPP